jgi:ATP-dependent DNA helicase RecG
MKYVESETVELKKSTSELKEAVISVVAILNKHGHGRIVFGVRNDGEIVGQDVSPKTLRDVSSALSENIEPRIYPKVKQITRGRTTCIQVDFDGKDAPYLAYGKAFMRVGEEDRQVTARALERMFLERNKDACRWESEPSAKGLADVNVSAVKSFINKANLAGRIDFKFTNATDTLTKLGLMDKGRLLKGGEVLFCGENPMEVQAAVFATTDKRTFLDIKQFKGNLFDLLRQSETYIKEHMDWRVEFGGLERNEIPEVPLDALREALVNSLCHRDYRIPKGNEVAVFKDRIEIYNPGAFPDGYQPEDFITGRERSILRNPIIAETLFKCKDVERWGSGLKRIADECLEKDVSVEFQVLKSGFLVSFHRKSGGRTARRGGLSLSGTEKVTVKVPEKVTVNQRKMIEHIARNPHVTIAEMAQTVDMSERKIKDNIAKLKTKNLIRRIGADKGGHWEISSP